jgi:hypothetical protein
MNPKKDWNPEDLRQVEYLNLRGILQVFRDGDELGWTKSLTWLWENHTDHLVKLILDISKNGMREPIVLGWDERIWDGHHRIAAALALNLEYVPMAHPKRVM